VYHLYIHLLITIQFTMNTRDAIRDLDVRPDSRRADCPYCQGPNQCRMSEHSTVVLEMGILSLTPEEVVAFKANPNRLVFQRTRAFNNSIYTRTGPMVVVNSKDKTVLGIGLVTWPRPDFFDFSEMTVVADIPIPRHFYENLSAWSHKPTKNPLLIIVPASARPYKRVRAFHTSEVQRFATFVEGILSSIVPLQLESEVQYLDEYPTPMLVYVQDDHAGEKVYATLKKTFLFHEHADDVADETAVQLVKRLLGKSVCTRDALRHINIAEGEFQDTSLWYMYKRVPGCMDRAGLAWLPNQQACIEYFSNLSIPLPVTLIVRGFPEDPITMMPNLLFSTGGRTDLTAEDALYHVTARTLPLEDAVRVLIVQAPGMIGHNRSLHTIMTTFSQEKMEFVGKELNSDIIARLRTFLTVGNSTLSDRERADNIIKLFKYVEAEALEYIRGQEKLKATLINRAYHFKRLNVWEYPELEPVCDSFLVAVNSLYDTDIPHPVMIETFRELKVTTAAVAAAYPELKEPHTEIEARWTKWHKETARDTPELSAKFWADAQKLRKYIDGLKSMI